MQNSIFNLDHQNNNLDSKIVVGLERISTVFRALLWQESTLHNITPIQTQILIFLATHTLQYCKVSYLAKEFLLSKPTISEAIKLLEKKEMIQKIKDENDTRSFTLELTSKGKEISEKLFFFPQLIILSLENISQAQKNDLWENLLAIIDNLQKNNVTFVQRMCLSCNNYQEKENFCVLLQKKLEQNELRLDCPEHSPI